MTEQKPGENPQEINVENLTAEQLAEIEESEKFILDFKDEDLNDPDKSEELKKHLDRTKTTIHQKKHFREKVTNLEKELEPFKKPKAPEKKPDQNNQPGKEDDRTLAVEFRQDHPELSREVALEVIAHAKAYGITPEEALAKPVIKSYIKSVQKDEDIDEGSPQPKGGGGSITGIEKRDWSNATEAEIQAQRNKILGVS